MSELYLVKVLPTREARVARMMRAALAAAGPPLERVEVLLPVHHGRRVARKALPGFLFLRLSGLAGSPEELLEVLASVRGVAGVHGRDGRPVSLPAGALEAVLRRHAIREASSGRGGGRAGRVFG